jgi:cell division protein FtsL
VRLDSATLLGKSIDNSQVIREVDPRASRDLWWLILLGAVLVLGGVLYAWPHLQLREAGKEAQELSREKERLLEENRKLRLEKAVLENLRRVETIATRDLGLRTPAPENTVIVEIETPSVPTGRVARAPEAERSN